MSTLQTWVNRAMIQYWIDAQQYKPEQQLQDANVVYHTIEDFIVDRIGEWYFWDISAVDTTVVWQSEYTFPEIATWDFDSVQNIEAISIKYTDDGNFVPVKEINRQTITQDLSQLWNYYTTSNPVYFIADNSYFIYPAPTEAVSGGIKLYGIKWLRDIELTTTEDDMFGGRIPRKYFHYLSQGLEQYILRTQGKSAEAINSHDRFEKVLLPELIWKLWNRKIGINLRQPLNVKKYTNGR